MPDPVAPLLRREVWARVLAGDELALEVLRAALALADAALGASMTEARWAERDAELVARQPADDLPEWARD